MLYISYDWVHLINDSELLVDRILLSAQLFKLKTQIHNQQKKIINYFLVVVLFGKLSSKLYFYVVLRSDFLDCIFPFLFLPTDKSCVILVSDDFSTY